MVAENGQIICDYCGSLAEFEIGDSTVEFTMGPNKHVCAAQLAMAVRDFPKDPCAVKILVKI